MADRWEGMTLPDLRRRRTALRGIADRRHAAKLRAEIKMRDALREWGWIDQEIARRVEAKKGNRR